MALDAESLVVIEFLTALRECREIVQELQDELRLRQQVAGVSIARPQLEGNPYDIHRIDGTIERFYKASVFLVTCTLTGGSFTEWFLEIYWNNAHWLVETTIYIDSEEAPNYGARLLRDYPERYADTFSDLIYQTKAAARGLVEDVDVIIDEASAWVK